jgi:hypothetical protein
MALRLMNGYDIMSPGSSVSGVALFVGHDIRGNVPQHFAEKALVGQKYAQHPVAYVSRNETFVRSFRRQT